MRAVSGSPLADHLSRLKRCGTSSNRSLVKKVGQANLATGPTPRRQKNRAANGDFYASKCPAYRLGKSRSLTDEYKLGVTSLSVESYHKVWTVYRPP